MQTAPEEESTVPRARSRGPTRPVVEGLVSRQAPVAIIASAAKVPDRLAICAFTVLFETDGLRPVGQAFMALA